MYLNLTLYNCFDTLCDIQHVNVLILPVQSEDGICDTHILTADAIYNQAIYILPDTVQDMVQYIDKIPSDITM